MGIIKIEQFDVDKNNNATHTLSNTVDTTKAFVRHTSSSDRAGGQIGSTGNLGPNNAHIGALLTGTDTVTFYSGSSNNQKFIGEVWRYTGSGGASEFIVRDHMAITIPAGQVEASQAITNLGDRNKVIPFLTGVSSTSTSVSDYDSTTVGVYVNSSGQVVARRGQTTVAVTAYIEVVEFTGSNWSVGHGISSSHDGVLETVTLNTDSTGTGGTTFDVVDWATAFIEGTMAGDIAGETGIADVLACFYPSANTTQVVVDILADGNARNDNNAYIHVLVNGAMNTQRNSSINLSEGNNSYATTTAPTTGRALDDLALEWYSDTSGTGTAHARGRLNAYIETDGTIRHWVHRSGNNVNAYFGIVDLSLVDDFIRPVILTTNIPNILGQSPVTLTGTNFLATQGKVYISDSQNFADPKTEMSVTSWNDTEIIFTLDPTGYAEGNLYIFVQDSNLVESSAKSIYFGEEPYYNTVASLSPNHYWRLDGDYTDTAGANNMSVRTGSCSFVAQPITRNNSESLAIYNGASGTKIADSSDMNLSTLTTRTMGGWIQFNKAQTALVNIYEEGGGVNNLAFYTGLGGVLIAQFADTSDDNVHAYSDRKLVPGRPYHILFRFDYTGTRKFELLLDGIPQTVTFGNPLTATDLDSHSGDVSWGKSESTLEVFGTDVDFTGPDDVLYSDWYSWKTFINDTTCFNDLFLAGIKPNVSLASDTEANMQTALDAISTIDPDVISLTISGCTGGNFTLECDGVIFPSTSTYDIIYKGGDTLTWINKNGCNVDQSRILTPNGGTVIVVNPATVTVSGMVDGSKVVVMNNSDKSVLGSIESSAGDFQLSVQVSAVDIVVVADNYKLVRKENLAIIGDTLVPIVQEADYAYDNPI
jgi:hypothetical protein